MATNRDERMKEITDRLQAGLEELFNSEKYAEYLRVMSQFHHYSFNNTLLIAMQKPDATLVAGYHAWEKKFNRHVMKGEKGIQIIAPAPVKEKQEQEKIDPNTGEIVMRDDGQPETEEVTIVIPRFKVSTVFDLSQTDGDPLPELGPGELTASVENYALFMKAIRSVAPVPIRFDEISSGAKGYYDNIAKEIVIQSGMSEMQTMKTAVHETAHAILHDRDIMQEQGIQKDQMTKEVEAESVAFVSLAHFELDTSDYSFPYIAGWSSGRDTKELKSSLDTIRKTSSEIIDGIEASIREQMRELQEPELSENLYIDENTQGISVDGHEGTWRSLYGQEINGEMFYLMESEEYGETAGNILLHKDGELVAEDLWSGINYEAMEAVKEFFDQKGISYALTDFPLQERYKIEAEFTPQGEALYFIVDNVTGGPLGKNGDVQTYDNRAKLTEQLNAMNQEKKPIYRKSATYAHENNEIADYRFSMQENRACKECIEKVIRENFDGMHLDLNVVKPVIERFGAERVAYVLANTVQLENWDERYSNKNKEWAAPFQYPDESSAFSTGRRSFLITSHPAVLDGFISRFRKELQERGLEIDGTVKNEMAVGYAEGFITVQRVDNGYDYTIYNQKCRPLDGGVLENPKLNIDEAVNEILKAEGLSRGFTWDANYETIMAESEGTETIQTEQEPSLTYYVSSCMDCPVMGEYREAKTFAEAAILYEELPDLQENGGRGIGFMLDDTVPYAGMYPLVQSEKGVSKMTALEEAVSNHPLVQEAMKEASQFVQESREAQLDQPDMKQEAGEVKLADDKPQEKQPVSVDRADGAKSANTKESVLKALRERKSQIKEKEKQRPEQKNRDRRKGEQSL